MHGRLGADQLAGRNSCGVKGGDEVTRVAGGDGGGGDDNDEYNDVTDACNTHNNKSDNGNLFISYIFIITIYINIVIVTSGKEL